MAGCEANWPTWQEFNERWNAALRRHNAAYLHMREFAHFTGKFKGWTELRRRALLSDCLDCLQGLHIWSFGSAMFGDDFRVLSEESQQGLLDPYVCCFQDCLYASTLSKNLLFPGDAVDVVYSEQDEFSNTFRRVFSVWKESNEGRSLGRLAFRRMVDCPGLQLADLMAYELTHYYHLRKNRPELKVRVPFKRICDQQLELHGAAFKYLPRWKIQLKARPRLWEAVQEALWRDALTWEPLLSQQYPEPTQPKRRISNAARVGWEGLKRFVDSDDEQ